MRRLQRHWDGAVTESGRNPEVEPEEPGEDLVQERLQNQVLAALLRYLVQEELSIKHWV